MAKLCANVPVVQLPLSLQNVDLAIMKHPICKLADICCLKKKKLCQALMIINSRAIAQFSYTCTV